MQVVIALIVTPQGFPLTYEVLCGNTADKTTLKEFLQKIEKQYGKARRIWVRELQGMKLWREELLMKLGAARQQAPSAWQLVEVVVAATFTYHLRKDKLRQVRRREGRYLLRSNLTATDPVVVWTY